MEKSDRKPMPVRDAAAAQNKDEVLKILSLRLRSLLMGVEMDYGQLQEVRLRIGKPLIMVYGNREYFVESGVGSDVRLDSDARLIARLTTEKGNAFVVAHNECKETMEYISNYSLYAFEDELKQGFLTIQGGHRVGVVGKVVIEGGRIKSIRHISGINIRLAHQIKGCASRLMGYVTDGEDVSHTLIISPPRCGKTTLLRDMIRQLSNGTNGRKGKTVGVVDERSELGACYMGIPQNDLGIRTDVLDCCPKAEGMLMLIRSMSPDVVAVDEIGGKGDLEAIEYVIHCGCKLIATVHGSSMEDVKGKPMLGELVGRGTFERFIVLNNEGGVGNVAEVRDGDGTALYKE